MTNQVDISPEAIEQEWQMLSDQVGISPEPEPEVVAETPPATGSKKGLFSNMDGVDVDSEDIEITPESMPVVITDDEQIEMATVMISGAISMVLGIFFSIDTNKCHDEIQKAARAYAVVITKYYKGGLFEFLAKYKEEIAAVGATIGLVKVIKMSKRLEKAPEKEVSDAKPE